MTKLSKRYFIPASAGAGLLALILIALDLYAGSEAVRERVETQLSQELGAPVKLGGLHYSLWRGLRATDVTASTGGTALALKSVSARFSIWPLFSRRLVVNRLVFQEPTLVCAQEQDGRWKLALPEKAPKPKNPDPGPVKPASRKASKLEFSVQAVRVQDATLRFIGRKGDWLAVLEAMDVDCPHGVTGKVQGKLSIGKAMLRNGFALETLVVPFSWDGGKLAFSPIDARLAGGSVRGAGILALGPGQPLSTLDLLFDGVDLNRLLVSLGQNEPGRATEGALNGNLDLYGSLGRLESLTGRGQVRLHSGRMEQIPLLQLIGKVLPIEEFTNLELRQAQLDLRAAEGKVFVDSLVMESLNLSLDAKGTSGFDGKLDLAARLAINPKISHQLPGWVAANFQPVPGSDRRMIGFNVTGTLHHPDTDLMRVMVGQKYGNQIMDLFRAFSGKKKKGGKKAAPEPEIAPGEGLETIVEPKPQPSAEPSPTP